MEFPEAWMKGKMYDVEEVAGFFNVSRDAVYRWIKNGYLKAFRLPHKTSKRDRGYFRRRVPEGEMLRFFHEHFGKDKN